MAEQFTYISSDKDPEQEPDHYNGMPERYKPFLARRPEVMLGYNLVQTRLNLATRALNQSYFNTTDQQIQAIPADDPKTEEIMVSSESPEEEIASIVDGIRKAIANLPSGKEAVLRDAISSPFFDYALFDDDPGVAKHRKREDIRDRVTHIEDGKYAVADATIINLVESYAFHNQELQKELDDEIPYIKANFKANVLRAAANGWISGDVENRLHLIDSVDILRDDMFSTTAKTIDGWCIKAMLSGKEASIIALAPLMTTARRNVSVHELNHVISPSLTENKDRRDLFRPVFGDFGSLIMNECLTEHLTRSLINGDFDIIRPSERSDIGTYQLYRELLATLANDGVQKIDVRRFYGQLYLKDFTFDQNRRTDPEVEGFLNEIEAAFPGVFVCSEIAKLKSYDDVELFINRLRLAGKAQSNYTKTESGVYIKNDELAAANPSIY